MPISIFAYISAALSYGTFTHPWAVSYTHLDVYKRQVLTLTPVTASAAEAVPSQVTETVIATPSPMPKKPQKKGWVKTKSGIRRYYRKGKRLTGFQKIGKNYFYFSAKGTLLKNTTVNKGYRGFTYYIDNKSHVIGRKKGSTYYTAVSYTHLDVYKRQVTAR